MTEHTSQPPGPNTAPSTKLLNRWEDVATVTSDLLDLIADQPELAEAIAPLIKRLQVAGNEARDFWLSAAWGKELNQNEQTSPWAQQAEPDSTDRNPSWSDSSGGPIHSNPSPNLGYKATDTTLMEVKQPYGEVRLQISHEDYLTVAGGLASIGPQILFTAKGLQKIAGTNLGGRQVPSTQLYLVLRFWRASGLISKAGGRKFTANTRAAPDGIIAATEAAWENAQTQAT
jgi:hypothetical protein